MIGNNGSKVKQEIEEIPLPEPVPWPVLDPDAYHGLAGDIVRAIEPETEADPVAILVQVLVFFGNLIGRSAHFVVEGTQHFCNLFAVLVGRTGRGRKGTSEGRARQIVWFVDEGWTAERIETGLTSGEGLIWAVRDPIYKTETIKEKGRIVDTQEVLADPGIEDKRLLVIEPEFSKVLRVCKRETNILSPTIRAAWDSGHLRILAKNSPTKATGAHISIVSHITREELQRTLPEIEGFSGFANRFLWVAVRRSKLLPDGGRDLDLSTLALRLKDVADRAQNIGRMCRDSAAATLWRKIYADLASDQNTGLLGAVLSRAEAQVLRLSMIYALLDDSDTIKPEHLLAALAIWRYCEASAKLIFGDTSGDPLFARLVTLINENPGITRAQMHRRISSNLKATDLVAALAKIRDAGLARAERIETGGKPAEHWFPARTPEVGAISAISPEPSPRSEALIALNAPTSQREPDESDLSDGWEEVVI